MWGNKILKYAQYTEPVVIEAISPAQKKAAAILEENALHVMSVAEAEAKRIVSEAKSESEILLEESYRRSREAEEKLQEADFQSKLLIKKTQDECEQIISDTKKQAAEDAKQTLARAHDEGNKQGYAEGYKDGVKQGRTDGEKAIRKEMKATINQANAKAEKTIQDAKTQTAEYFVRAEDDIVKVVMQAIEKIIPQHFLDAPQVILPVVREAINYVRDQKEVKIHVEPESYDLVLMARSEFQSMLTDGTSILEVVSDDALKPGDVVIETPNGGVDARLSTQLELMKDAIKSVLQR